MTLVAHRSSLGLGDDFEDVQDPIEYHYDDVVTVDVMSTPAPPEPSKPVNMSELLASLATHGLTIEERRALLELRDVLRPR